MGKWLFGRVSCAQLVAWEMVEASWLHQKLTLQPTLLKAVAHPGFPFVHIMKQLGGQRVPAIVHQGQGCPAEPCQIS